MALRYNENSEEYESSEDEYLENSDIDTQYKDIIEDLELPNSKSSKSIKSTNINDTNQNDYFIQLCQEMIIDLNNHHKEQKNKINNLIKLYKQNIKNAKKNKSDKKRQTGFTKAEPVPSKFVDLLDLEKGASMPRPDLTKKVYKYLEDNDLFYENDRRVFRADSKLKNIFGFDDSVNNCTSVTDRSGFTFFTLQTHLANCYKNENNTGKKKIKRKSRV